MALSIQKSKIILLKAEREYVSKEKDFSLLRLHCKPISMSLVSVNQRILCCSYKLPVKSCLEVDENDCSVYSHKSGFHGEFEVCIVVILLS